MRFECKSKDNICPKCCWVCVDAYAGRYKYDGQDVKNPQDIPYPIPKEMKK
jgi:hypothetical protein